jgi:hypothetical protein
MKSPPGAPVPPQDGFRFFEMNKFVTSFAADIDAPKAGHR